MIKAVLEAAGKKTRLIGTNGAVIGDEKFPTSNTTPESYVVQEYFLQDGGGRLRVLRDGGSSQALMLHRVGGIMFDYGLFTNISRTISGRRSIRASRNIFSINQDF